VAKVYFVLDSGMQARRNAEGIREPACVCHKCSESVDTTRSLFFSGLPAMFFSRLSHTP
jgi:hypothetical protein